MTEKTAAAAVPAEDMELINSFARRELSPEEVYTFPVTLCDNETDRDCERFSIGALERLAELFKGKTGIFDHDPKGRNQTARIYFAETVRDPERVTRAGEPYTYVRAKAYMMRTAGSADLIKEIDGGIKKEVSVSCSVSRRVCGICGADLRTSPCSHIRGQYYGGKLCDAVLDGVTDAYEWSFVAVPAQPEAGITKSRREPEPDSRGSAQYTELAKQLDLCRADISVMRAALTSEIIRLGQFCVPAYEPEAVKTLCGAMSPEQLISFTEKTRSMAKTSPAQGIFRTGETDVKDGRDDSSGRRGNSLFRLGGGKNHDYDRKRRNE